MLTFPYNIKVLFHIEDFHESNTFEEYLYSALFIFILLWIIEWTAYLIYSFIPGEIFETRRGKTILARHTMDFLSMATFSFLGLQAFSELGFDIYTNFKVCLRS